MRNNLQHLCDAYLSLLSISPTTIWRTQNQDIYAALRDAIAEASGTSSEHVQCSFESVVNIGNTRNSK